MIALTKPHCRDDNAVFVYNFFQSIIVNIPYIYVYLVISWLIESRLVSDDGAVFCLKIWDKKKL